MSKEKTDNTAISPEAAVSPERLEELTEGALESVSGGFHLGGGHGPGHFITVHVHNLTPVPSGGGGLGRIGVAIKGLGHGGPFRGGHGK